MQHVVEMSFITHSQKSDLGNAYHLSLIVGFDHGLPYRVMMTSSSASIFCVTGPVSGEFTGHRGIPVTKAVTRSWAVFFAPDETDD